MVLIAGPYRSGTGDDPAKLAANERAMHEAALEVFRRGHLPVTGEALALPLIRVAAASAAGPASAKSGAIAASGAPASAASVASDAPGSPAFDAIFHPLARRLVARCDAVLRIGGPSAGADEMVAIARGHGAAVVRDVAELPDAQVRR
ncbi:MULTISPECIES: DUF4406 domain-containing protein [unclassified Conexibacter]|uniref:DUF4406 domain-containing protein n=1 Tax=unclassified Conexibacter TaxID=2627773 RepID=UPI00351C92CB